MPELDVYINTGAGHLRPGQALRVLLGGGDDINLLIKTFRNLRRHALDIAINAAYYIKRHEERYPQKIVNIAYDIRVKRR